MPESVCDDPFRRGPVGLGGADVGIEIAPRYPRKDQRQVLQETLGDEADLDVAFIGGEFAADGLAVLGRLAVQVLVALDPAQGRHGAHAEMVSVGAHVVDGWTETSLNREAPSVEANDIQ